MTQRWSRGFGAPWLGLLMGLFAVTVAAQGAADFPNRPVTIMVAYSAGGATDVAARTIAEGLSKLWGQPVVVENRPGAGGNIGAVKVARDKPDGYSLVMVAPAHAINVSLYPNAGYDALKDFESIGRVSYVPNVIVANPSFKPTNVKELIALAKSKPGEQSYSSGGVGTSEHLSAELFMYKTGTKMTHIPYKGTSAALPDLLSGQVLLTFGNLPAYLPHIKSGKLKVIAVNSPTPLAALPGVPTANVDVPGYDVTVWLGLLAPAGTPPDIVAKINRDLGKVLEDPAVRAKLDTLGMQHAFTSPAEFRALIAAEVDKYAAVIKAAGIKAE